MSKILVWMSELFRADLCCLFIVRGIRRRVGEMSSSVCQRLPGIQVFKYGR